MVLMGCIPSPSTTAPYSMADLDQLFDVAAELGMRAVNRLALLARKLDLAARLDGDRGALAA